LGILVCCLAKLCGVPPVCPYSQFWVVVLVVGCVIVRPCTMIWSIDVSVLSVSISCGDFWTLAVSWPNDLGALLCY